MADSGFVSDEILKMCFKETYTKVCQTFPIQNGLEQGEALLSSLFSFSLE
jgi:hypothetical protein